MLHIVLKRKCKESLGMGKIYTAAMIVIGNEILSGRTQDKNINYVAVKMVECGVALKEVRVIPDIEDVIIRTVNEMRSAFDYVFTSGGIGPTHDDITSETIAKAFDVEWRSDARAYQILSDHYGAEEFSLARQKMAMIPVGADLIPNPVSAAPGFNIGNVYVMAGVPRIFQAMVDHVAAGLKGGDIVQSRTVLSNHAESVIAEGLGIVNDKYPTVDIGSYPHFKEGKLGVNVVLRSSDVTSLDGAEQDVKVLVGKKTL